MSAVVKLERGPAAADTSEELNLLAESAADFCARSLERGRLRALRDSTASFDRGQWQTMAELGWSGVSVPESHGGLGLGVPGVAVLARALGGVAAPEPLVECATSACLLVASDAGQADLSGLLDGSRVVVTALGPIDVDPFAGVRARSQGEVVHLEGQLPVLPLGLEAEVWLVPASRDGDAVWCRVDQGTAGAEVSARPQADGTVDARLTLSGCAAQVLLSGIQAERAMAAARTLAELAASAYQLGLAEALLDLTRDYLGTRRQFNQAIGSFQSLQHRLVDVYLDLRLATAVVDECCAAADLNGDPDLLTALASRACERSGAALLELAREAIQLHGAMGYTDDCDVGQFVNRALVVAARYGRPDAHLKRFTRLNPVIWQNRESAREPDPALLDFTPPDGDWNALDNETFRRIVHDWHLTHYPAGLRNLRHRVRWAQCKDWYAQLYARGFAAPGWPVAHGGMGLAPDKLLIFIEERERLGIARTPDQGIIMVGPLLMKHGSTAQQDFYLPRALSGEHIWCQGYSEPNAGSDLASLRTSAVRDGDEFVINGQKIWTTLAQDANWMFCLVRTDPEAKPQAGISFILIDFSSPGITVRPIRNMAGDEEFCEVFFDNVRVPCSNLVGELNGGWTIAKNLLSFERFFIGSPKQCRSALARAAELATTLGLADDPVTVERYTRLFLEVGALESLYKVFADQIRRGEIPGADVSLLKIFASEAFQRLTEFLLDLGAEQGASLDGVDGAAGSLDVLFPYYNARPTTIYGGSNEIQRNILAKMVLGLPAR